MFLHLSVICFILYRLSVKSAVKNIRDFDRTLNVFELGRDYFAAFNSW